MIGTEKRFALALAVLIFCGASVFSASREGQAALAQGCDAFKSGDWYSAMISLRKAAAYPENDTADTRYMLIAAEMYAGAYAEALSDCDYYLRVFQGGPYESYVQYQKGRAFFYLGDYEKAVLLLSDFCHQYADHEMYASALFWIAESFYVGYNYDEALPLYERIVREFSSDAKAQAAEHRIEAIAQRTREEKLLYLLKKTGEAYLAAKEDYEKQLHMYDAVSITSSGSEKKAADLQKKNEALAAENERLQAELADLQNKLAVQKAEANEGVLRLKAKARQVEALMGEDAQ